MVMTMHPSQPSWRLQPKNEPRGESVLAQEVLQGCFPDYNPQNLKQEHNFCLGIPISKEPELLELDFGEWQHDMDASLLTCPATTTTTSVPLMAPPSQKKS
jgi:hypothetical protein